MELLEVWQTVFVATVMGAGALLLGYTEFRRLLHAALDDRYGEAVRFWRLSRRLPSASQRIPYQLNYAVAFTFCIGLRDLTRFVTLLGFDLFVIFALLSPFWRSVFFHDWNPALAAAIAVAGASTYVVWKLRGGLQLCLLHGWSDQTGQCERCGELNAQAEEQARLKNTGKGGSAGAAAPPAGAARKRFSWQGVWERRLHRLEERLAGESPGMGR